MPELDDDSLCQKCGLAMGELLDGVEDTPFLRQIRKRVETDPACRSCFASYKQTAALCKQALPAQAPEAFGDRLTSFLRRECGGFDSDD